MKKGYAIQIAPDSMVVRFICPKGHIFYVDYSDGNCREVAANTVSLMLKWWRAGVVTHCPECDKRNFSCG